MFLSCLNVAVFFYIPLIYIQYVVRFSYIVCRDIKVASAVLWMNTLNAFFLTVVIVVIGVVAAAVAITLLLLLQRLLLPLLLLFFFFRSRSVTLRFREKRGLMGGALS